MPAPFLRTLVRPDRPRLLEPIADPVARHKRSWPKSRKIRLSSQEKLPSPLESAPKADHLLICAEAKARLPQELENNEITIALEGLGSELTIDLLEN